MFRFAQRKISIKHASFLRTKNHVISKLFSTAEKAGSLTAAGSVTSGATSSKGNFKWKAAIRIFRAVRVGLLTYAVYEAGYQSGLIAYAQNPKSVDDELLKGLLSSTGATTYSKGSKTKESYRVHGVATRVVEAAKNLCQKNVTDAKKTLSEATEAFALTQHEITRYQRAITTANQQQKAELTIAIEKLKEELQLLQTAKNEAAGSIPTWEAMAKTLEGDWQFLLTDATSVNAFVTDMFPKRVFVHSGLLQRINPSDDELAMILGHELSHVMMGHAEQTNSMRLLTLMVQLVLLTFIDPTGFFSLASEGMIATIAQYINTSHSRSSESEADLLSIQIAANGCFDTTKGARVFLKLSEVEGGDGKTSWSSTHPHSNERFIAMTNLSKKYNRSKECNTYADALQRVSSSLFFPPWMKA